MVNPRSRRFGKTVPCDSCSEQIAVLFCRADSAKLCLFCDQHVHSANLLSRKHHRSLICDDCSSEPVSVRCSTDNLVLCQECDLDAHRSCSVSASHDRSSIGGFSGCPSALDLASLWGLDLDDKKANQSALSIQRSASHYRSPIEGCSGFSSDFDLDLAWFSNILVMKEIPSVNRGEIVTASKSCGKQGHVIYKQLVELFKLPCGGGDNGGVDFENGTENENESDIGIVRAPRGKLRRSISSWQKGGFLGKGSFGTVYEGYTEDGFFFAVKEVLLLDQGSQGKQSIAYLEQEISLLKQFEHENIVQYLGTEKDESRIYIFLEFVTKGSLASLYQKYQLRDSQVSAYTRQILNGLKYLHDKKVIHRDIKCSNILVDASGSVKLADFGLAKVTKLNDMSFKGSPFWMAPEVVNLKDCFYGVEADIWSLGCTVLEMLTRQHPYPHLEGVQALFKIFQGEPPLVPDFLSRDARDFILKCLQVNPKDRPTAAKLLDHPFVTRPQNSFGPASPHNSIQL